MPPYQGFSRSPRIYLCFLYRRSACAPLRGKKWMEPLISCGAGRILFFDIVLGKYLGIITIGLLAILPTLLYAASVYLLAFPSGNIDIGSIIASYLGLFFLMSSYGAISIFCSSISNNPIVAFLLAVFACFIAFYGFTAISDLPSLANTTSFIRNLGIQEHYDNISRGVLTLSDFVYFLSLSALFILFTRGHLGRSFTPRKRTLTAYTIAIVVFFYTKQHRTASCSMAYRLHH